MPDLAGLLSRARTAFDFQICLFAAIASVLVILRRGRSVPRSVWAVVSLLQLLWLVGPLSALALLALCGLVWLATRLPASRGTGGAHVSTALLVAGWALLLWKEGPLESRRDLVLAGISFLSPILFHSILGITFLRLISVIWDSARARSAPRAWEFLRYFFFWPQLYSGTFLHWNKFVAADSAPPGEVPWRLVVGRLLTGLLKMRLLLPLIRGTAGRYTLAWSEPASVSTADCWLALLLYSVQFYVTLSGLSDLAVGAARITGYPLEDNFHWPYLSRSPLEFCRRWNRCFGGWLREYLYRPLGGRDRHQAVNYVVTFAASGLWHGLSLGCLSWGIFHGTGLAANRLARGNRPAEPSVGRGAVFTVATSLWVVLGWVPFVYGYSGGPWLAPVRFWGRLFGL